MARNLDPKCKLCRREGIKLFLKGEKCLSPKCSLLKRNYPPGIHGSTSSFKRTSSYNKQLREKQKAKRLYQLLEKQFKNYHFKAVKMSGDSSENILRFLETRFDNIVYRLGFVSSRDTARQLINHGHFLVNGKKVSIPSYQVKVGDVITVNKKVLEKAFWKNRLPQFGKTETMGWLSFDPANLTGKMVSLPKKEEVPVPFDMTLILEFYSR
ncbi:30S ribosomal protein S4 [Patescibacteria group bacterium]|nr:30S ribosomal protein S4 [Patescibacteria group bacterium]